MLRDIAKHKTQFLSIFLMAFLGVFVFAGVGGESVGLEVSVNEYYNATNLADGWIYSANLDDDFVDEVKEYGTYYVHICESCYQKHKAEIGNKIDQGSANGYCSVEGCENEAEHYVDFMPEDVLFVDEFRDLTP